jgi:hypothetical protein
MTFAPNFANDVFVLIRVTRVDQRPEDFVDATSGPGRGRGGYPRRRDVGGCRRPTRNSPSLQTERQNENAPDGKSEARSIPIWGVLTKHYNE